jgi:hypothetical protein
MENCPEPAERAGVNLQAMSNWRLSRVLALASSSLCTECVIFNVSMTNPMKFILTLILSSLVACNCYAAPPTRESVEKLTTLSMPDDMFIGMQKHMETATEKVLEQSLSRTNLAAMAPEIVASLKLKMTANIDSKFNLKNFRELFCRAYSEIYSQEEVNGLIAFFESPAGKAYLAKKSLFTEKLSQIIQEQMGPVNQKMAQDIQVALEKAETDITKNAANHPTTPVNSSPK